MDTLPNPCGQHPACRDCGRDEWDEDECLLAEPDWCEACGHMPRTSDLGLFCADCWPEERDICIECYSSADWPHHRCPEHHRARTVSRCGCGREYTVRGWLELPDGGRLGDDVEDMATLQLRHCRCGSTLAVPWWVEDDDVAARVAERLARAVRRGVSVWTAGWARMMVEVVR